MAQLDWLREYLVGQPFRLHTALSEQECKDRLEQVSRSVPLFIRDVTGQPAAMWKRSMGKNRIYAWNPSDESSPWLKGVFYTEGSGTIIVGRAGADFILLVVLSLLEAFLIYVSLTLLEPIQAIPLMLFPVASFIWKRRGWEGGQLIDYVQALLVADNMLDRRGDPIYR